MKLVWLWNVLDPAGANVFQLDHGPAREVA